MEDPQRQRLPTLLAQLRRDYAKWKTSLTSGETHATISQSAALLMEKAGQIGVENYSFEPGDLLLASQYLALWPLAAGGTFFEHEWKEVDLRHIFDRLDHQFYREEEPQMPKKPDSKSHIRAVGYLNENADIDIGKPRRNSTIKTRKAWVKGASACMKLNSKERPPSIWYTDSSSRRVKKQHVNVTPTTNLPRAYAELLVKQDFDEVHDAQRYNEDLIIWAARFQIYSQSIGSDLANLRASVFADFFKPSSPELLTSKFIKPTNCTDFFYESMPHITSAVLRRCRSYKPAKRNGYIGEIFQKARNNSQANELASDDSQILADCVSYSDLPAPHQKLVSRVIGLSSEQASALQNALDRADEASGHLFSPQSVLFINFSCACSRTLAAGCETSWMLLYGTM